jgi:hypothetical protein
MSDVAAVIAKGTESCGDEPIQYCNEPAEKTVPSRQIKSQLPILYR